MVPENRVSNIKERMARTRERRAGNEFTIRSDWGSRIDYTQESWDDAVEFIVGMHPSKMEWNLRHGIDLDETEAAVSHCTSISKKVPFITQQVTALAASSSLIDTEVLELFCRLKPITVQMEIQLRLFKLIKDLGNVTRDLQTL